MVYNKFDRYLVNTHSYIYCEATALSFFLNKEEKKTTVGAVQHDLVSYSGDETKLVSTRICWTRKSTQGRIHHVRARGKVSARRRKASKGRSCDDEGKTESVE